MSGTSTPRRSTTGGSSTPVKAAPPDKGGHVGNMDEKQRATLDLFEKRLSDEKLTQDDLTDDKVQRDIVLSRFLRARDWNIDNATKMYEDTVKWRKEVDIDQLVKPKSEGGYDFEEREVVAALGWKMYFHSTDRFFRPIFVQDLSNIQVDEVFKHTTPDRIVRFFAVNLENAVRHRYQICTDLARKQALSDGATQEEAERIIVDDNFMILNIAGLGMGTFWSFKNKLQELLAILDANFPELSGRVQIINAPWLFATIWGYIKPWLPPNTAAKIDIAGADFHSTLLPYIDPAELPMELGGTCNCQTAGGCAFSDRGPWTTTTEKGALEVGNS